VALSAHVLRAAVCGCLLLPLAASAARVDPAGSQVTFAVRAQWGPRLQGRFTEIDGALARLTNGRYRMQLHLAAASLLIADSPRLTAMARGPRFFAVERHPDIDFDSDEFARDWLRQGGRLRGVLRLRGVQRVEHFLVAPATCARPGIDCDVMAKGEIRRGDYGIGDWRSGLAQTVELSLRIRLQDDGR